MQKINIKLFIIFIFFFIIEVVSQFTWNVLGDDINYYAMGKLVSEGLIPYRDFFYAHPPLQLIFYGILFKISHTFGINVILFTQILKLGTIALTIFNYYLIYSIAKEDFVETTALIATTIGLFSLTSLYNASFGYGIDVALFFFLLGLKSPILRLERNQKSIFNYKQTLFFILSAMYRFHLIFLIIGYHIYVNIIQWKKMSFLDINKPFLFFLSGFIIINFILISIVPNYFNDVFLYHIDKPKPGYGTFQMVQTIFKANYLLFLLPFVLVLMYLKRAEVNLLKYLIIPVPFMFYFLKNTFFGYYFMLIIPFLAVIGAYTISLINKKVLYIPIILFVVVNSINYDSSRAEIPKLSIEKEKIITGEPSMVSYLKVHNGNKVMDNNIDINSMMFETGFKNITLWINEIKEKHPIVIAKEDEGVYPRIKDFRKYIKTCNLTEINKEYRVYQC